VAIKKGIYTPPVATTPSTIEVVKVEVVQENKKKNSKLASKEKKKKEKNLPVINTQNDDDIVIINDDYNYLTEQIINNAYDNIGINYRGGGMSKDGFDCSGLIYSTFRKFAIELPRSSVDMAETGTKVDMENAKKGDLIFFINRGQKRINHVGMVVEVTNDEIKFIHSSTQSGVTISSLKEPYYKRTFKQVNRVIL
jgi:cell wall-associated NlpC family hydrolase